jgi:hypothetical protein
MPDLTHRVVLDMADESEEFVHWCRQHEIQISRTEFRGSREALGDLLRTWCFSGDAGIDQQMLDEIVEIRSSKKNASRAHDLFVPRPRRKGGRA